MNINPDTKAYKKYVPDLNALSQRCQLNYAQLLKLMPQWEAEDYFAYDVALEHPFTSMTLTVEERFQFTMSVRVSVSQTGLSMAANPQLLVRLYHDARMAEVVEEVNGQPKMYLGRYPYPNEGMYQPDEKMQLNLYLGEWLSTVLKHGLAKPDQLPHATS